MTNLFRQIRDKVLRSDSSESADHNNTNNLIALGVLMWEVAQADDTFLPEEKEKIEEVLTKYGDVHEDDMGIIHRAIEEASIEKVELFSFARDACEDLERPERISIIEHLFRIACIDMDLDEAEVTIIRKINDIFGLDHNEFIDSKVKVKKEFGMDTAGL